MDLESIFPRLQEIIAQWLSSFLPGWLAELLVILMVVLVIVLMMVVVVMVLTLLERKILGRLQDRIGPNRVGPYGVIQPVADTLKLLFKEDIVPEKADKLLHLLAPIIIVVPAMMVWAVMPFGKKLVAADLNIAVLYVIALGSVTSIAILMAGWGSGNKYSLLAGFRAVAQLFSYEVPMGLAVLSVVMAAGSMSLQSIVKAQSPLPFAFVQPIAFLIYFICGVAEVNRSPFDLPEAESEIIAGYHIEYTGVKFAMFFLAEYINTFAVSAMVVTLFLGGWKGPILPSYVWFFIKVAIVVYVFFWLRASFPRLRIDQLLNFAWKFLVPLGMVNLLVTGIVVKLNVPVWLTVPAYWAGNFVIGVIALYLLTRFTPKKTPVSLR
ncbi:MAG: NADH-quinone oxidoreductase subunit NuoH [Chloroflexi bacterium]|nr:MAG: NADH-quinone oxidoreductase subunit NuoH [Chloroflexota bacterium]